MEVTDRPAEFPENLPRRSGAQATDELLARALSRAWWALLWERSWPRLATVATALGIFLILSWAGLWFALPPIGRAIGLVLAGLVILASAIPLARLRLPTHQDSLRRLDRGSGLPHRPATAMSDEIATGGDDKGSLALWQAHMALAAAAARRLKAGTPAPKLLLRDPFAVRALVVVLLVATFV